VKSSSKETFLVILGGVLIHQEHNKLELLVGFWNHVVAKKEGCKVVKTAQQLS
jgi:hypothetical protein